VWLKENHGKNLTQDGLTFLSKLESPTDVTSVYLVRTNVPERALPHTIRLVARLSHSSVLFRRLGRSIYYYICFSFILLTMLPEAMFSTTELLYATHCFTDLIPCLLSYHSVTIYFDEIEVSIECSSCNRENRGSIPIARYHDWAFSWFCSVTPGKCWDDSLNKARVDSFQNPLSCVYCC